MPAFCRVAATLALPGRAPGRHRGPGYPADFDAIVAGAPAVNAMYLHGTRIAISQVVHRTPDSDIPPEKYPLIHNAALEACDALDGVKDGVIENPSICHFDPTVLICKDADGPSCLTSAQVDTARALYAPVKDPNNGATVFPSLLEHGSELGWAVIAGPQPINLTQDTYKYIVFPTALDPFHVTGSVLRRVA